MMAGTISGASGTILPVATSVASFPWISAITTGGQVLSGISSRLTSAAQAEAEARALRTQGLLREQQELQKGAEVTSKGYAIAAASGVDPGSGSPLAIMMDNINTAIKNATIARRSGDLGAEARFAQAGAERRSAIPDSLLTAFASRGAARLNDWVFTG
jgi:hypothetical protein